MTYDLHSSKTSHNRSKHTSDELCLRAHCCHSFWNMDQRLQHFINEQVVEEATIAMLSIQLCGSGGLLSSSTWASETIAISTRMYCRIQPSLATSFSWNVCHCTVRTICEEYRPLLQFLIRLGATCIHFSLHKTDEVVRLYSALQIKSNHVCKSLIPISFLHVKLLRELAKIPTSKIVYCTHTHT